jgi:hypothetical protein
MLRTGKICSLVLLMAATRAVAQPPPADTTATPSPPAAASGSANVLEVLTTLRGSVGWRDNVLLSPFAPISRTFGRAEADLFLYYPVGDAWELVSLLSADVLRYISAPPETKGDQLWFGHAQARWTASDRVRVMLKADGFLEDTVVDLSETEAVRLVAPTRVQGGFATAVVRLQLPGGFVAEPLVQTKRTDYREFAGDFDAVKAGGRLEWKRSEVFALSATWAEHRRKYAERNEYSASGRPLPGTKLRFEQREGELRADTRWTAGGRWHAGAAAGWFENRDRASGFFDYDQKRARLTLDWEGGRWLAVVEGEARRNDYLHQTVGAGMAPPARISDFFETRVRVERQTAGGWTLFAENRWERNRSNEFSFSYRANTVLAGIQRDL